MRRPDSSVPTTAVAPASAPAPYPLPTYVPVEDPLDLMHLNLARDALKAALKSYLTPLKMSQLGHHHNGRARAIIDTLPFFKKLADLTRMLKDQCQLFGVEYAITEAEKDVVYILHPDYLKEPKNKARGRYLDALMQILKLRGFEPVAVPADFAVTSAAPAPASAAAAAAAAAGAGAGEVSARAASVSASDAKPQSSRVRAFARAAFAGISAAAKSVRISGSSREGGAASAPVIMSAVDSAPAPSPSPSPVAPAVPAELAEGILDSTHILRRARSSSLTKASSAHLLAGGMDSKAVIARGRASSVTRGRAPAPSLAATAEATSSAAPVGDSVRSSSVTRVSPAHLLVRKVDVKGEVARAVRSASVTRRHAQASAPAPAPAAPASAAVECEVPPTKAKFQDCMRALSAVKLSAAHHLANAGRNSIFGGRPVPALAPVAPAIEEPRSRTQKLVDAALCEFKK